MPTTITQKYALTRNLFGQNFLKEYKIMENAAMMDVINKMKKKNESKNREIDRKALKEEELKVSREKADELLQLDVENEIVVDNYYSLNMCQGKKKQKICIPKCLMELEDD